MCICAVSCTPLEGVIVYGRRQADDARQVSRFFENRGVLFDYSDVDDDPVSQQRMVELSGQANAVVIKIGQKIFVGFNPTELERALP